MEGFLGSYSTDMGQYNIYFSEIGRQVVFRIESERNSAFFKYTPFQVNDTANNDLSLIEKYAIEQYNSYKNVFH